MHGAAGESRVGHAGGDRHGSDAAQHSDLKQGHADVVVQLAQEIVRQRKRGERLGGAGGIAPEINMAATRSTIERILMPFRERSLTVDAVRP